MKYNNTTDMLALPLHSSEVYNLLELRKKAIEASSGKYIHVDNKDKKLFNMIKNQIKPYTKSYIPSNNISRIYTQY